jgi:hypothetical protein
VETWTGAIDQDRRRFISTAAAGAAAVQLGLLTSAEAQPAKPKLPDIKPGTHTSFGPLKQTEPVSWTSVTPKPVRPADRPSFFCRADPTTFTVLSMSRRCWLRLAIAWSCRICAATAPRDFFQTTPSETPSPSAVASNTIAFMDALKIDKAILAGFD